jgi:cell division protein FtsN
MAFRSSQLSSSTPLRQQGSTLVGIIIGLVIGLVIAVIVALMITKGQSPFTERAARAKPAESSGQIADPNKPMYGNREAARSANRDFERDQRPAQPAPNGTSQPAAPSADPLQAVVDRIQGQPEKAAAPATPAPLNTAAPPAQAAAPAPSAAGEDKWVYYLQAGAYRETSDAEAVRAKLALLGFEASVTDRSTDSGVLHRVRVGPFTQVEAMNKVRSKLSESGVDVAVVRNQK